MRILTKSEIQELSFPDCTVEEMCFDISKRTTKIKTNSGYLSTNGGVKLKNCKLIIKDWKKMKASIYHAKTKQWEKLDVSTMEKLVDICEFKYGNEIILHGFGNKSGQWIEVAFLNGNLEVECD